MGLALHTRPRAEYQLSTKVGRFLRPVGPEQHEPHGWDNNASLNNVEFSYTHEAIMQQHRESLLRLGCGTIDALVIHDMEQSSEDVPVRPCPRLPCPALSDPDPPPPPPPPAASYAGARRASRRAPTRRV